MTDDHQNREDERMTITEFLLARIAEDERAVRYASVNAHRPAIHLDADGYPIVSPARLLAECAAKRRIVEGMVPYGPIDDINAPEILGILASIWSDHPDFRPEWRP